MLGRTRAGEGAVGDVNVAGGNGLGDNRALAVAERHVERAGGRGSWDVGGERRFVEKPGPGVAVDNPGIQVDDGIARLQVVHVHEASDEDRTRRVFAAIEREPAVVEHPVGAGADDRIGGRLVAPQRRRAARILGIAGQQGAGPVLPAIERLEQAKPRIRIHQVGTKRVNRVGNVHGAVVVRAGQDVQRVARGHRARRFVLALEVGIAFGKLRSGHHVDVGARHDLLLCRERRPRGDDQRKTREPEAPGTVKPD